MEHLTCLASRWHYSRLMKQGQEPSSPNPGPQGFQALSQRRGAWHLCRPWLRGWEDGGSPAFQFQQYLGSEAFHLCK